MEGKPFWKSKTISTAAIVAVLSFSPIVEKWASENVTFWTCAVTAVFAVLRYVTIGKVTLK